MDIEKWTIISSTLFSSNISHRVPLLTGLWPHFSAELLQWKITLTFVFLGWRTSQCLKDDGLHVLPRVPIRIQKTAQAWRLEEKKSMGSCIDQLRIHCTRTMCILTIPASLFNNRISIHEPRRKNVMRRNNHHNEESSIHACWCTTVLQTCLVSFLLMICCRHCISAQAPATVIELDWNWFENTPINQQSVQRRVKSRILVSVKLVLDSGEWHMDQLQFRLRRSIHPSTSSLHRMKSPLYSSTFSLRTFKNGESRFFNNVEYDCGSLIIEFRVFL